MTPSDEYLPEIGSVYHLRFNATDNIILKKGEEYHDKFFVVIGIDENNNAIGYTFINTPGNKNLPQEIVDFQYKIKSDDYDFLNYDSNVDCSDIKIMSIERFYDSKNRGKCAKLSDDDYDMVANYLVLNPSIEPKKLKRFNLL